MRRSLVVLVVSLTVGQLIGLTSGCQLEQLFPIKVGEGAARLTVANTGAILKLANSDPDCGFESPTVVENVVIEGEPGSMGSATWTIRDCTIDLGWEPVPLGTDCAGNATEASGLLVVSGTRRLEGMVTGDTTTPIIPERPDAVTISLSADMFGFDVLRGAPGGPHLLMKQGHVDIDATVHLARSASQGVCSIPTDEVTLGRVVVADAVYRLNDGEGHEFNVQVPAADIAAQVGSYQGRENSLSGRITVWDDEVQLGDGAKPLDPDYSRDTFVSSFSCTPDLQLPVEYECPSLRPRLADGAARLSVATVGRLTSVFSKDTTCGMKSPAVQESVVLEGLVGREGGVATYTVSEPCEVDFGSADSPEGGRVLSTSCDGEETRAFGKASFTGSWTIRGRLTGNPEQPVIPLSQNAVEIALNLNLEDVRVVGGSAESMTVTGAISGKMEPTFVIEEATGACSYDIPIVKFSDLAWAPGARATIHTDVMSLGIGINGSLLQAQSGRGRDGRENVLEGSIDVDDERYELPLPGAEPNLDPSYVDHETYMESFMKCETGLRIPASDEDCNMHQVIGDGVARLIVQTVGTIAGAINSNDDCGYANTLGVLANPTEVIGDHGEMGSLSWAIEDCPVGASALSVYSTDCTGGTTYVEGTALVDSARTVHGIREPAVDLWIFGTIGESIVPNDHQSVELWVMDTQLTEFATYGIGAGETEPLGILKIHAGTLDAFVEPVTGEHNDGDSGFVVPTPIAQMSGVRLRNATATLTSQGMTFEIDIQDAQLQATNGRVGGAENAISGTVTIDGDTIQIGGALDPGYDAQEFEASYVCEETLAYPVNMP